MCSVATRADASTLLALLFVVAAQMTDQLGRLGARLRPALAEPLAERMRDRVDLPHRRRLRPQWLRHPAELALLDHNGSETERSVRICAGSVTSYARTASSTSRHRAFASRIWSIELQSTTSRRGLATRYARQRAREIATFSRFAENRNSRPRGMSAPDELASEKKTTSPSWPWNLSTVPTRTAAGSFARRQRTCAL